MIITEIVQIQINKKIKDLIRSDHLLIGIEIANRKTKILKIGMTNNKVGSSLLTLANIWNK